MNWTTYSKLGDSLWYETDYRKLLLSIAKPNLDVNAKALISRIDFLFFLGFFFKKKINWFLY